MQTRLQETTYHRLLDEVGDYLNSISTLTYNEIAEKIELALDGEMITGTAFDNLMGYLDEII